ncbi:MAG: glucose-1-phosphate cytidylyltransferase [Candidatus Hydrogenedentota bacterium]
MKTVILCGGLGTRLREETEVKPKPMVEVGGKPILWHILNIYYHWGYREFVLALGYKGEIIKEYFLNYYYLANDFTITLKNGKAKSVRRKHIDWKIDLVDTGLSTMTGGRLYRLRDKLRKNTFMLTYGDGVADINIKHLLEFHKKHKKIATVTAVRPVARFGEIIVDDKQVISFKEKAQIREGWINGGFFVFEPKFLEYLDGDECVLEGEPMERLVSDGQLMAFKHNGFWQCMDTYRDKQLLETLWSKGEAPWKIW